jgi:hypothetical protein
MKRAAHFILAAMLTVACASGGRTGSTDRNRITQEQLAQVSADNAYEAIRQLQPQWLDSRGPSSITDPTPSTAVVFMDGARLGGLDYLRNVSLIALSEMRFLEPGPASARYGVGLARGAIELISKGSIRR